MEIETSSNCGIYKITNLLPDAETGILKVHIGSSIDLRGRRKYHFSKLDTCKHKNAYLQNAYNKIKDSYGDDRVKEYFKWEILEEIESNPCKLELRETILSLEQSYLDKYILEGSLNLDRDRCYNMCPNASNRLGHIVSEETRLKIGLSSLGRKYPLRHRTYTPEHRKAMSDLFKGRTVSPEWRTKISKSLLGRKHSEETKLKMSLNNRSKDTEVRNKMSMSAKRNMTEAKKQYLRDINVGKKASEEAILNMRLSHKNKRGVLNLTTGEYFESLADAARHYNLKRPHTICEVCKNKIGRKTYEGFRWAYADILKEINYG